MKKIALALVFVVAAAMLAGCSTSYVNPYEGMELGENAQAVLDEHMGQTVDDYQRTAEGSDNPDYFVDVAGIEPTFVGYEVYGYNEELDEDENTYVVDVFYISGDITDVPETLDPITEQPEVHKLFYANVRSGPENPDADEAAALAAAQETLEELFPPEELEGVVYGIKHYIFLYDTGVGEAVLIGQALDGDGGYYSEKIVFAEE